MGAVKHECLVRPEDLGPYLLGQLPPPEVERIRALVTACPSCTEEVRQLRPVVESLAIASSPPSDRPRLDLAAPAPRTGVDGLLTAVRRERARRRGHTWRVAAAAAAVAAALTLGGVAAVGHVTRDRGAVVALDGSGVAHGTALVAEHDWGTSIVLTVRGLTPGTSYGAWLEDRSGARVPAGTFTPSSDGTLRLDLSALMPVREAAAVGVTQLGGADVLRHDF